ncbi:hypothetical protein F5I97DRAFT_1803669 [Phlebopus sp. FC_14]|nr:hypothetical protein F5I97DRAFT_1803669 [Phlebopus sp. FC_14]
MPVAGAASDEHRTANDSEDGSADEDDIMKAVDEIYEFVPSHYRRYSRPPITHPAHTTYLVDLHARWIADRRKPAPPCGPHHFTTFTFCQAIVDTLAQSAHPHSHILWTCKAMAKFARTAQIRDLDSFTLLTGALAKTLSTEEQEGELFCRTRIQLAEWLGSLFDSVATWTPQFPDSSPMILAVVDILDDCRSILLHCGRATVTESQVDLPDIVTVLATHIYVNLGTRNNKIDVLLAILERSPIPTTFARLTGHFLPNGNVEVLLERFASQVDKYSAALRSRKLFKLDASLLACALYHFETNVAASQQQNSAAVTKYRHRLMDAVDEAERRCFGRRLPDSSPSMPLSARSKGGNQTHRRMPSGHWEWEEMVGSWIRQTPVHKKQKVDNGCSIIPQAPLQRGSTYNTHRNDGRGGLSRRSATTSSSTTKISRSRTCSRSSSPLFSQSDSLTEESDTGSEYHDDHDKENISINPPRTRKRRTTHQLPQKKRRSNFSSLIADAQMNRIVLHPVTGWKPSSSATPATCVISASQRHAPRSKDPPRAPVRSPSPPPQATSVSLLPSDDSLDLFACKTSSPARC